MASDRSFIAKASETAARDSSLWLPHLKQEIAEYDHLLPKMKAAFGSALSDWDEHTFGIAMHLSGTTGKVDHPRATEIRRLVEVRSIDAANWGTTSLSGVDCAPSSKMSMRISTSLRNTIVCRTAGVHYQGLMIKPSCLLSGIFDQRQSRWSSVDASLDWPSTNFGPELPENGSSS